MPSKKGTPVVVTTSHRGVFFGYAKSVPDGLGEKTIVLTDARMCVSWSADMHGVMGLASLGPSEGCRIGPTVQSVTLYDVTSVMEVGVEAEANWKRQLWS